jgi:hypothetical protein
MPLPLSVAAGARATQPDDTQTRQDGIYRKIVQKSITKRHGVRGELFSEAKQNKNREQKVRIQKPG